ncbi:MAG: LysR substrate-binding domain-containing protein [Gammaproteobacteria bacterium]
MVTLKDLQYLVALDTHRHFGRAAEACFVSQPTLSGQFKKLEDRLGLTLVERNRHQVVMTPAGQQLAVRARSLIADAQEFERHADSLLDPLKGDIHLGLVPTLAPYLLSRVMHPLSSTLPGINFFLHEHQTEELTNRLDSGHLDLLILPWKQEMECFDRIDLFSERLQLAAPDNHPILKVKRLSLDSLEGQHVLTLEDGHCLRDDVLDICFSAIWNSNSPPPKPTSRIMSPSAISIRSNTTSFDFMFARFNKLAVISLPKIPDGLAYCRAINALTFIVRLILDYQSGDNYEHR